MPTATETTVQTTSADRYFRRVVEEIKPRALKAYLDGYVGPRAAVLGLSPQGYRQAGVNAQGQPVYAGVGDGLTMQERLDRLGPSLLTLLMESGEYKALHEKTARAQIAVLGGMEAIDPAAEWGFLLEHVKRDFVTGQPVMDDAGKMQFELPGLPFRWETPALVPGKKAAVYSVSIEIGEDGRGTATFDLLNAADAGPVLAGDPL